MDNNKLYSDEEIKRLDWETLIKICPAVIHIYEKTQLSATRQDGSHGPVFYSVDLDEINAIALDFLATIASKNARIEALDEERKNLEVDLDEYKYMLKQRKETIATLQSALDEAVGLLKTAKEIIDSDTCIHTPAPESECSYCKALYDINACLAKQAKDTAKTKER
jgi:DNA repair exonuclease SbcCD ATPase subunit